jgi:uncharacterized damage-inducible protein DinB
MALRFTTSYREDALSLLHYYKRITDTAISRVTDEQFYATLDPEMNSIAVIMHHVAGNLRSRWRDFLTTDGEKPERNRDAEFDEPPARAELQRLWEEGWRLLLGTIDSLNDDDLARVVLIRGERHSVVQAISRAVAHTTYHCGQIVLLAKHFRADNWQSLSIPRGASSDFTRRVASGEASQR